MKKTLLGATMLATSVAQGNTIITQETLNTVARVGDMLAYECIQAGNNPRDCKNLITDMGREIGMEAVENCKQGETYEIISQCTNSEILRLLAERVENHREEVRKPQGIAI